MTKRKYFPELYRCLYCKYISYKGKAMVYKHLWFYHREMLPFRCSICAMPFPGKKELILHGNCAHITTKDRTQKIDDLHTSGESSDDERVYISPDEQGLADYQDLPRKKWQRNFPCKVCGSAHDSPAMLADHKLIVHHNMIDNYRCEICPEKFTSSRLLVRHIKAAHRKGHIISCKHCGSRFGSKALLFKHLRGCHPDNTTVQLFHEFGEKVDSYLPCLLMGGTDGKNFQTFRPVLTRDPSIEASNAVRTSKVAVAANIASIFSVMGLSTSFDDVNRIVGIDQPLDIKPQMDTLTNQISESQNALEKRTDSDFVSESRQESEESQGTNKYIPLPLLDLDERAEFTVTEHSEDSLNKETTNHDQTGQSDEITNDPEVELPSNLELDLRDTKQTGTLTGESSKKDTSDVAIKEDPCHQFPSDFEVHLASAEQIDILRSVDEVIDVHKIHNSLSEDSDSDSSTTTSGDSGSDSWSDESYKPPVKRRVRKSTQISNQSQGPEEKEDTSSSSSDGKLSDVEESGEDSEMSEDGDDTKQILYGFEILRCCPICRVKCKSKHLKLHMRREHPGKATGKPGKSTGKPEKATSKPGFTCEHCDFSTKWRTTMKIHMRRQHTENPPRHMCKSCDFSTLCKESLRNHTRRIHQKVRFQCEQCPASYGSKTDLKDHVSMKHEGVYPRQCKLCSFKCAFRAALHLHMKRYHLCPEPGCKFQHSDPVDLFNHIVNVHNTQHGMQPMYKAWRCDYSGCKFVGTTKDKYNHMREIHRVQPHVKDLEDGKKACSKAGHDALNKTSTLSSNAEQDNETLDSTEPSSFAVQGGEILDVSQTECRPTKKHDLHSKSQFIEHSGKYRNTLSSPQSVASVKPVERRNSAEPSSFAVQGGEILDVSRTEGCPTKEHDLHSKSQIIEPSGKYRNTLSRAQSVASAKPVERRNSAEPSSFAVQDGEILHVSQSKGRPTKDNDIHINSQNIERIAMFHNILGSTQSVSSVKRVEGRDSAEPSSFAVQGDEILYVSLSKGRPTKDNDLHGNSQIIERYGKCRNTSSSAQSVASGTPVERRNSAEPSSFAVQGGEILHVSRTEGCPTKENDLHRKSQNIEHIGKFRNTLSSAQSVSNVKRVERRAPVEPLSFAVQGGEIIEVSRTEGRPTKEHELHNKSQNVERIGKFRNTLSSAQTVSNVKWVERRAPVEPLSFAVQGGEILDVSPINKNDTLNDSPNQKDHIITLPIAQSTANINKGVKTIFDDLCKSSHSVDEITLNSSDEQGFTRTVPEVFPASPTVLDKLRKHQTVSSELSLRRGRFSAAEDLLKQLDQQPPHPNLPTREQTNGAQPRVVTYQGTAAKSSESLNGVSLRRVVVPYNKTMTTRVISVLEGPGYSPTVPVRFPRMREPSGLDVDQASSSKTSETGKTEARLIVADKIMKSKVITASIQRWKDTSLLHSVNVALPQKLLPNNLNGQQAESAQYTYLHKKSQLKNKLRTLIRKRSASTTDTPGTTPTGEDLQMMEDAKKHACIDKDCALCLRKAAYNQ